METPPTSPTPPTQSAQSELTDLIDQISKQICQSHEYVSTIEQKIKVLSTFIRLKDVEEEVKEVEKNRDPSSFTRVERLTAQEGRLTTLNSYLSCIVENLRRII